MATSPVEERNFYLSLSIVEGQRLAQSVGFSVPSPEVQEHEVMDIIQKWFILSASGILEMLQECSAWMINVLREHNDFSEDQLKSTKNIITSFGVGVIAHLLDQEVISIDEDAYSGTNSIESTLSSVINFITLKPDNEAYEIDEEEEEDE